MYRPKVTIYTDGSFDKGHGGWAAIIMYASLQMVVRGWCEDVTNNRMELKAVVEGLACLDCPSEVDIITDSQLLVKGMTKWRRNWTKKKTSSGEWGLFNGSGWIKNPDLWFELFDLASVHKTTWWWVRSHTYNEGNERADKLALNARLDKINYETHFISGTEWEVPGN